MSSGVEYDGDAGRLNGWAGAQNGFDGLADELALNARASWRILGDTLCCQEGAVGIPHDAWLVGFGYFDDRSMDDGDIVGVDTYFASGAWSASAEIADYGDDMAPMPGLSATTGVLAPGMGGMGGAETPWSVTVGYLLDGAARPFDERDGHARGRHARVRLDGRRLSAESLGSRCSARGSERLTASGTARAARRAPCR